MKRHCKSYISRKRRALLSAVALASAMLPTAVCAQFAGNGFADPLAPGYLHRASLMLRTANPLGALDQTAAAEADLDALPEALKTDWLAIKGAALFERHDPACLANLRQLAAEYPASAQATQALLTIGDWHWFHKDWHQALDYYGQVEIAGLATGQRNLYSYRKALAYLNCGLPEKAAPLFASLESADGFRRAAAYYSAYILYLKGDYDRAYDMMAEEARMPGQAADGIYPLYYMTQIEYLRGRYDDVIAHADAIMAENHVAELMPELHRVAGLSHFKKGDLRKARRHLEQFVKSSEAHNDDAIYALAASEYADADYDAARDHFRTITDRNNMLAQGAYLYLGQIAQTEGDLNEAAMAFRKGAEMAFDPKVAETSLYNYIATSAMGGNVPFASSIALHEEFLSKYPSSPYASEVEESLASAFFHENNYAKALEAINRVSNPTASTLATKQKILYRLGCGELSSGHLGQAALHLREAAAMSSADPALAAEASLWLGDALYRAGDNNAAESAYLAALRGRLTPANAPMARYGLAYSQFSARRWKDAADNFAAVAADRSATADIKGDALIRQADCLLYQKQYRRAAEKYLQAVDSRSGDHDYAAFRHAVVAGVTDGTDTKIRELDAFLRDRRASRWTPEVLLEAGRTFASLDRPDKAAPYFSRLSEEYPQNDRSRAGALSLALSYAKQGQTDMAEATYRDIIRTWPTSEEAAVANDDMRRIAAARGTLMEYAQFLASIKGAPQIDPDEMDAISFEAAETAFADNPADTARLEKYIADYPDGRFLANALMDIAEAADNAGDSDKALDCLARLLSARADSPQVPAALFMQGELLEDKGDRPAALAAFLALEKRGGQDFAPEATAGVMRNTDDASQQLAYARRLMAMGGVSAADADAARFHEASGLPRSGDSEAGIKALEALAAYPDNLSGARSAVELGEWYLAHGDHGKALPVLEKFTDAGSIHAYWLARGYIALSDAYRAAGNEYLAKEYLRNLKENYPGDEPDIADAIANRLNP